MVRSAAVGVVVIVGVAVEVLVFVAGTAVLVDVFVGTAVREGV